MFTYVTAGFESAESDRLPSVDYNNVLGASVRVERIDPHVRTLGPSQEASLLTLVELIRVGQAEKDTPAE